MAGKPEEISEYFRQLHSSIPSAPHFFNLPLVTSSPPPRRAGDMALSNFESAALYHFDQPETENGGIASCSAMRNKTYYWREELKSDISKKLNGVSSENETGDFSCDSEESGKVDFVRYRNSSKRSRTAEIHNLSEKRRRSRINEKIKALQTLIPNSSKTDKVSMLDEAIEYLKQLQLKVQMLTMRKGLSMQTMCLQQIHQPISGFNLDDGNGEINASKSYSLRDDRPLDIPLSQRTVSNDSILLSSLQNANHSFGFVPRYSGHYDPTNSKDVRRGGTS